MQRTKVTLITLASVTGRSNFATSKNSETSKAASEVNDTGAG